MCVDKVTLIDLFGNWLELKILFRKLNLDTTQSTSANALALHHGTISFVAILDRNLMFLLPASYCQSVFYRLHGQSCYRTEWLA
mmetsp:Transcript_10443/g.15363  ORF Transcript_10443/g.15363 Transcript_10443/m.15363 type:complete len:84 (+) Transcript_10443:3104-3355(+)